MILCQNSTCRFLPRGMISPLVNVDKVYSFRHEIPPVEQSYIQPEVVGFPHGIMQLFLHVHSFPGWQM